MTDSKELKWVGLRMQMRGAGHDRQALRSAGGVPPLTDNLELRWAGRVSEAGCR